MTTIHATPERQRLNSESRGRGIRPHYALWIALWAIAAGTTMLFVPLLPVDETRYASVAWEMWLHSAHLLPTLNGEPYHHKPPLLFWMIHLGWAVFGVNEWWLRLMPALFALASVFLTHRLASQLWPDRPRVAVLAPPILLATGLWLTFVPLLMFDVALSCWVLLAVSGLLQAYREGGARGWLLFSAATLLGLLTKGPVMLLHVGVPAVLIPFFVPVLDRRVCRWRWYTAFALGAMLAVAGALLWAIPAAMSGGPEYARALLWEQTQGRIVEGFAHPAPWWWYLPFVPVALLPWIWWPPLWRAMRCRMYNGVDRSLRFCALWAALVFVAFCLISGKRLHYMLPLLPVLALLAARVLDTANGRGIAGVRQWPLAFGLAVFAIAFAIAPALQPHYDWPAWVSRLPVTISVALLLAALALMLPLRPLSSEKRALQIACVSVLVLGLIKVAILEQARPYYDLHQVSAYLARSEHQQAPIAHIGAYQGQFHFLGRLLRPIETVPAEGVMEWAVRHDDGLIVSYLRELPALSSHCSHLVYPYRGQWVALWAVRDIIEHPDDCVPPDAHRSKH